jgi:S1-C subfamily serine protease
VKRRALAAGCIAAAAAIAAGVALSGGEESPDPVVVRVELEGATSAAEVATGFVVGPGRVVTVAHLLRPGRRLVVRGSDASWRGRVVRRDVRDDLALVAVDALRDASPVRFQPSAGSGAEMRILVRRDERSAELRATVARPIRATLHSPNSRPQTRPALELRANVALGDSGAPVVDRDGRLAGVVFARASDARGTAYAVSASALSGVLSR